MTAARSKSPAEMCTRPNFSTMSSHCVPFPEAGAPAIMTRLGPAETETTARREQEAARERGREDPREAPTANALAEDIVRAAMVRVQEARSGVSERRAQSDNGASWPSEALIDVTSRRARES